MDTNIRKRKKNGEVILLPKDKQYIEERMNLIPLANKEMTKKRKEMVGKPFNESYWFSYYMDLLANEHLGITSSRFPRRL